MCREREKKPVGHRIAASISNDDLNGFHNIDIYNTDRKPHRSCGTVHQLYDSFYS